MALRLHRAVEERQLDVVFQAKVMLSTNRVVEFEALCRWSDEELGAVSPAEFIPLAEQSGVIVSLGQFVLETACRQAASWISDGHDVRVAVNLSPVQLAQPDLVDVLIDVLSSTGLAPDRLRVEITETVAVTDLEGTADRLRALRQLGVLVSLDDFGTGHSSLSLLRSLPVDGIKIDKSFVDAVDTSQADHAVVAAIVELARQLGMTSIAEGVERVEQLERLRALGCDAAQGYLLGRPLPASQIVFESLCVS